MRHFVCFSNIVHKGKITTFVEKFDFDEKLQNQLFEFSRKKSRFRFKSSKKLQIMYFLYSIFGAKIQIVHIFSHFLQQIFRAKIQIIVILIKNGKTRTFP